ncbi:hypothetical protein LXL04_020641 [Taraxacum kok-saghyz]
MFNIKQQSGVAQLLRLAKIIKWDESSMAHRQEVEAVDRSIQEITQLNLPFGGKIMILGGDFKQFQRSNSYYLDIDIKDLEQVIVYALIMNYDDRFCQIVITVTLNSNLPKIWTTIGHICQRHTVLQLRWLTYLNFDFKKEGWSHEDDMLLCEAQKIFGNRWTEIAKRITSLNLKFCAFTTKAKIRVVAWEPTLSATIMIPMSMWELLLSFYLKEEANDYIIHLSTLYSQRAFVKYHLPLRKLLLTFTMN